MSALTLKKTQDTAETFQEIGRIVEINDDEFVIRNESGTFHAKRAVSCIVEPQVDDEVLFAGTTNGVLYIIAILERQSGGAIKLSSSGDVELCAAKGKLTLVAQDGLDFVTSKAASIISKKLNINSEEGSVFIDTLSFLGKSLVGEVAQAKTFLGTLDTALDRFTQRVKSSYRFVEKVDQVRAGHIEYIAKDNMRLRGQNTLVHANFLVKFDGEQIHIG